MATDNALAAIPTDQLMLKLLQELLTRVETLEQKDHIKQESRPSEGVRTPVFPINVVSTANEPYGYLLDCDVPTADTPLVGLEERANALRLRDPLRFAQLEQLGFAGAPADGRLDLASFWAPSSPLDVDKLAVASTAMETVSEVGCFAVTDFDSHSASIEYGCEKPIMGSSGELQRDSAQSFQTPAPRVTRETPFRCRAPWKRLMYVFLA